MTSKSQIILALDYPEVESTIAMIEKTLENISIYKLGLEFFLSHGKEGVKQVKESFPNIEIFLDLKLHDIPNTVAGACSSVSDLKPSFLTVHASGGMKMIEAAVTHSPGTSITAVTVLTSLDTDELAAMGMPSNPEPLALSLAHRAVAAGATSIVCSPHEVSVLRSELPKEVILITPGVRPSDSSRDDQSRVMTPRAAIEAGSTYVVIGRPITKAPNPSLAASHIASTLL